MDETSSKPRMSLIWKESGIWGVLDYVLEKPASLGIVLTFVLLAVMLGFIPSAQTEMNKKLDIILSNQENQKMTTQSRYDDLQRQLSIAFQASTSQNDKMLGVMQGMCFLMAQQSKDSSALSYCK